MLLLGTVLGVLCTTFDVAVVGGVAIFSRFAAWVFVDVLFAVHVKNRGRAAWWSVFFNIGLLESYLLSTSFSFENVSRSLMVPFGVAALAGVVFVCLAWTARHESRNLFGVALGALLIAIMLLGCVILYHGIHLGELVCAILSLVAMYVLPVWQVSVVPLDQEGHELRPESDGASHRSSRKSATQQMLQRAERAKRRQEAKLRGARNSVTTRQAEGRTAQRPGSLSNGPISLAGSLRRRSGTQGRPTVASTGAAAQRGPARQGAQVAQGTSRPQPVRASQGVAHAPADAELRAGAARAASAQTVHSANRRPAGSRPAAGSGARPSNGQPNNRPANVRPSAGTAGKASNRTASRAAASSSRSAGAPTGSRGKFGAAMSGITGLFGRSGSTQQKAAKSAHKGGRTSSGTASRQPSRSYAGSMRSATAEYRPETATAPRQQTRPGSPVQNTPTSQHPASNQRPASNRHASVGQRTASGSRTQRSQRHGTAPTRHSAPSRPVVPQRSHQTRPVVRGQRPTTSSHATQRPTKRTGASRPQPTRRRGSAGGSSRTGR
ncbi:MAG: hypothetical protein ACI4B6_09300 [Atopobiaceae bacterium]